MKRYLLVLAMLVVPALSFAQTPQQREAAMLKSRLGLNDSQITQVIDIQRKTMDQVRQDSVHLRLLRAELAEALLPSTVNQNRVNELIDQTARTRANMQKVLVDARIQLRKVMGDDAFFAYMRFFQRHRARIIRAQWMARDGNVVEQPRRAMAFTWSCPAILSGGSALLP
ncbi:MAG TPA: periplasmic heavy metal sensor [Spirochaetia bacterium]|nr:periplasmic heavy metal sensor [Spirochaetia bacterium]